MHEHLEVEYQEQNYLISRDNGKLSRMFVYTLNKLMLVGVLNLNYGLREFSTGQNSSIGA